MTWFWRSLSGHSVCLVEIRRAAFDLRVFLIALALFLGAVLVNGFPFIITDTIRYGGMLPGLSDAPVLLNQVMQPLFAVAGLWGPALLNMCAAAYVLARLATLPGLREVWFLLPAVSLVSLQYVYAGMVSTEIWTFITLGLMACLMQDKRVRLLDVVLIAIGALGHATMFLISFGGLGLMLIFFAASWPRIIIVAITILAAAQTERGVFQASLPDDVPMRYTYISGEILSHHPHIYTAFCKAEPDGRFCQEPYAGFIHDLRADPANADRIDRVFKGKRAQLFIWGADSFWSENSALPPEHRMSRVENEVAGQELWSFALRNHLGAFFEVMPAKAVSFWHYPPPGIWLSFDTWFSDTRIRLHRETIDQALAGYEGTLQDQGALLHWHYRRVSQLAMQASIVVGLIAPLVLIFIARDAIWRLSFVFAGFVVGNFATISVAGAIVGRYTERAVVFAGLNGALLIAALLVLFAFRPSGGEIGKNET